MSATIVSVSPLVFCARANPSSMNRRNIQTVGEVDRMWGRKLRWRNPSRICVCTVCACCVCALYNITVQERGAGKARQGESKDMPLPPSASFARLPIFTSSLAPLFPHVYMKLRWNQIGFVSCTDIKQGHFLVNNRKCLCQEVITHALFVSFP